MVRGMRSLSRRLWLLIIAPQCPYRLMTTGRCRHRTGQLALGPARERYGKTHTHLSLLNFFFSLVLPCLPPLLLRVECLPSALSVFLLPSRLTIPALALTWHGIVYTRRHCPGFTNPWSTQPHSSQAQL